MSADARERFLIEVNASLQQRRMGELERRWEAAEERAQQESVRAQAAEQQTEDALQQLRQSVLSVLALRGILPASGPTDSEAAVLAACKDAVTLQRYILRAVSATTAAEVFLDS